MKKISVVKFYFLQICGLISMISILLPWMSYGVGSKTGIDIAKFTLYIILASGVSFLIFSYLAFKSQKGEKFFLFLTIISSLTLFVVYAFELIRIAYQTMIAKNLPVEMFGAATLAAAKIHVGYGILVGVGTSLLISIINIIAIKRT